MLRRIVSLGAVALGIVAALGYRAYRRDMRRAYQRITGRSKLVPSPYGDIEYTEGGAGPHVLISHGSGGGFDQGELIVQAVLSDRFHWIAPSRFGYLRSTYREGSTFDEQAHAYAALLDHLGIDRAAVVALSHGGPSALLFAALYPERVSSLALISCGVTPNASVDQLIADRQGKALAAIFGHDGIYWVITTLFKRLFIRLMGTRGPVMAEMAPAQREIADRVIEEMNPVSPRSAGALFDNRAELPGERIAAIRAPTLIVHATDDTLQLFYNAEFAAATIPGAKLMRYERGGHLVMAVEQDAIRAAVQAHIGRES